MAAWKAGAGDLLAFFGFSWGDCASGRKRAPFPSRFSRIHLRRGWHLARLGAYHPPLGSELPPNQTGACELGVR